MDNYIAGAISSKIALLTTSVLNDFTNPHKYSVQLLLDTLESDPVAYACCQLKALRASQSIGDFEHPNKELQSWGRGNIESMEGTLADTIGVASHAMPLGFSNLETIFTKVDRNRYGEIRLRGFHVLDPRKITYQLQDGSVQYVKYNDGGLDKYIPYWKVIHTTNTMVASFAERALYGSPEMLRAYPYIKLKQLIFAEMGISAKTLATGILVGYTDSNNRVEMYGPTGQPISDGRGGNVTISAAESLSRQLATLENHARLVTDKQNQITALSVPAGENFWNLALSNINTQIMRCFLVPSLIFDEGSGTLGVNGLGYTHLSILDSSIEAVVGRIRDNLIEKVMRPLITLNFGPQDNYGEFKVEARQDPQTQNLLTNTLMQAMSMGLISQGDNDAVNVLRQGVGLAPITPEEQQFQAQLQAQLQSLNTPPAPEAEGEQQPMETDNSQPYP
jgi:hypothetical protein